LRYRFTSRWQRVVGASLFGCFFFLETGAYFDKNGTQPGEIAFTSALLAVIVWGGVRAARAATLLANDDQITVRGLFRTRSWSWDEIDGFVVETLRRGRALAGRLQFVELAWSAGRRPPVRDSRGDEDTGALQSCHVNLTFSLVEP
jgi:hypothetical protein